MEPIIECLHCGQGIDNLDHAIYDRGDWYCTYQCLAAATRANVEDNLDLPPTIDRNKTRTYHHE